MLKVHQAIPVVVRSKEWVCSSLIAGITGSNTAEGMDVCLVFVAYYVGRGLCDEIIVRLEEFKWVRVSNCM